MRQEHFLGLLMNGGRTPDDFLYKRLTAATNPFTGAVHIKAAFTATNCDLINTQWGGRKVFTLDAAGKAINTQIYRRVPFFTQPLGVAKEIVMAGDHVCVFKGAHRYMILRECGVYYKIVSSGNLHGEDRSFIWTIDRLRGSIIEDIVLS